MPGYSRLLWVHTGPAGARSTPTEAHLTKPGHRVTAPVHPSSDAADPRGATPMSDRYQSLVHTPVGRLLAKNLGLPTPVRLERYQPGDPLVDGTVAVGGAGRLADDRRRHARRARHRRRAGRRCRRPGRPDLQGPGVRRHRPHLLGPARRPAGVLHPAAAPPGHLPPHRRARHSPGVHELGPGAGRAARPRRVHPLARQGGRPGRHRAARVRRPGGRRRARLDAGVPALRQVGLRLGPGGPDRVARGDGRRRGGPGPDRSRWPARSRSSPAPAAASASRSPGSCTATARRSSGSTYPRRPAS